MFLVALVLLIASSNILVSSAMQGGPGKEGTDCSLILIWEESISANAHFEIQPSSFTTGSYGWSRHCSTVGGRADGSIQRHMMGQSTKVPKRKCVVDDLLTASLRPIFHYYPASECQSGPFSVDMVGHLKSTRESRSIPRLTLDVDKRRQWYMPLVWAPAFKCDMWLLTGLQVAHRLV